MTITLDNCKGGPNGDDTDDYVQVQTQMQVNTLMM